MSDEVKNASASPDDGQQAPGQNEDVQVDPVARIEELEAALTEAVTDKLRTMADMENTKKRLIREKEQFCEYANESVLSDLLPVLDNLDMALAYLPQNIADPAMKGFAEGIRATRKIFLDTLARHGLATVGEEGEGFDPTWHEAVGYDEAAQDKPANTVCKLMQRGYKLKDRLLRPARVLVSKPC